MEPSLNYNCQRRSKKTILFFGEGLGETTFLKYLKSLYHRPRLTSISIVTSKKGTADGIVIDADKRGDYDKKIVVLDNDKPQEMKKARQVATDRNIELIENTPCLEHTLLVILSAINGKYLNSTLCKKKFQSNYINRKKRGDLTEYAKLFPKKLLNTRRKKIRELNRMISIIATGK